ncbi:phosphoenolpyruvate--protein phosphotransferase, partial [Mesorhizobium sp. M00.F.Ca.ET.186.01.1.1]
GAGEQLMEKVSAGSLLILDGATGDLIVSPDTETLARYEEKAAKEAAERAAYAALKDLPAETTDGHRVHLMANMAVPEEADALA